MNMRLLIADDNRDMATSLSLLLRPHGFEIETAYDGGQAIEKALRFHPDVLILDLCMPILGGFEVASQLRAIPEFADKHFIAITGYKDDKHLDQASQSQFNEYLVKPFRFDKLSAILHQVSSRLSP